MSLGNMFPGQMSLGNMFPGQMSLGNMFPGQMSQWQLESVFDGSHEFYFKKFKLLQYLLNGLRGKLLLKNY